MQQAIPNGGQPAMGGGSAAPGTYYAPPPGTDQAAEGYAAANDAYKRAIIRFNQQRTGLLQQYGYKGTVDPTTGLMTNVGVDAGNSYGALQQLLHTQAGEDQQAQFSAEDRGLVGGLANQGEQELSYQHHGQSSSLANTLFGNLADLDSQQLDAKNTLDNALWQLTHGATTDAIGAGDYSPADVSSVTGDDSGGGTTSAAAAHIAKIVGTPAQIAAASAAAYKKAGGRSTPAAALAARSAGLNAAYGLASKAAAKAPAKAPVKNAYNTNKNKRG